MSLVPCPKCSTNLKIPAGATAAVRCPKCQTVFQPPKAQPAFEVVDDAPAPARSKPAPPRPAVAAPPPARPAPKPAAKPAAEEVEFEVVDDAPAPPKKTVTARPADDDRPRSKRRDEDDDDDRPRRKGRRDDDDDDDRPRSRRSRDDDDDDDRPRSRRSRDDDDEDDDRPRKRRRDDDYDDDYDRGGRGGKPGAAPAKIGLLLISISLWGYLGSLALLIFFLLLLWLGVTLPYGLFTIPGLVGLANWIVALVGGGFAIAGPARCRGLAIATVSVAAVHLILTFVVALESSGKGFSLFQGAAAMSHFAKAERIGERLRKNPNDQQVWKEAQESQKDEADALRSWEKPSLRWEDFGTILPDFDSLLITLIYNSKTFGDQFLRILAGACELARLILLVLLLKSLARAVKAGAAEDKARMGVMAVSIGAGVCVIVLLLISVIAHESKFDSLRTPLNLAIGAGMLVYLIHAGTLVFPALAAQQAHSAAARRR